MDAVSFVTYLYAVIPVISVIAYVPQIARLARHPRLGIGLSLPTWGLWTVTSFVTLLYAVVVVRNNLFAITAAVNLIGSITIFSYAATARFLVKNEQE